MFGDGIMEIVEEFLTNDKDVKTYGFLYYYEILDGVCYIDKVL